MREENPDEAKGEPTEEAPTRDADRRPVELPVTARSIGRSAVVPLLLRRRQPEA